MCTGRRAATLAGQARRRRRHSSGQLRLVGVGLAAAVGVEVTDQAAPVVVRLEAEDDHLVVDRDRRLRGALALAVARRGPAVPSRDGRAVPRRPLRGRVRPHQWRRRPAVAAPPQAAATTAAGASSAAPAATASSGCPATASSAAAAVAAEGSGASASSAAQTAQAGRKVSFWFFNKDWAFNIKILQALCTKRNESSCRRPPRRRRSRLPEDTAPLRHSRMNLTARQNTPAIDGAFYRPNGTLYQLQPSFHTQSTEPEPTARARRAGKEFY